MPQTTDFNRPQQEVAPQANTQPNPTAQPLIATPVTPPLAENGERRQQAINKQAFWLFGVIVGLAIKEGLVAVFPHIFASDNNRLESLLEGARFLVFFILITRFYLGSVYYFEEAYFRADAAARYPRRNFMSDFIFGLIHFLFLSGLSRAIELHYGNPPVLLLPSVYPIILSLVLLYDWLWYLASRRYDTDKIILRWAILNLASWLAAVLIYFGCLAWRGVLVAELLAFIPVLFISCIDIAEIITGKQLIWKWFSSVYDPNNRPPQ